MYQQMYHSVYVILNVRTKNKITILISEMHFQAANVINMDFFFQDSVFQSVQNFHTTLLISDTMSMKSH